MFLIFKLKLKKTRNQPIGVINTKESNQVWITSLKPFFFKVSFRKMPLFLAPK